MVDSDRQTEMNRFYYSDQIAAFLDADDKSILGALFSGSSFSAETTQRDAWLEEIQILKSALAEYRTAGSVYFEYSIPRLGRRIDVVAVIRHVIFVLEFKVGERKFTADGLDQVWDYALDLKNFHETSHEPPIAPVLIATESTHLEPHLATTSHGDRLFVPLKSNRHTLEEAIRDVLRQTTGAEIDAAKWESGRYYPTPTIIEAARSLYAGHSVEEISRNDADAINVGRTSEAISKIIRCAKAESRKSICFVTGVPGAGKTLVGLNIATQHIDVQSELYSVFLSGNGPLVRILREALACDRVRQERGKGREITKKEARRRVEAFIQNVHHFRDDCLANPSQAPVEHVALEPVGKTPTYAFKRAGGP
jgi:hypothetical protein